MAWTAPRTWVTGETVTAALMNTHIRDNLLETSAATVTTAGDLAYADAANSMGSRLAIGPAGYRLVSSGSAPTWKGQAYDDQVAYFATDTSSGSDTVYWGFDTIYWDSGSGTQEISVTLTTGTQAMVFYGCSHASAADTTTQVNMSYEVSGASSIAASGDWALVGKSAVASKNFPASRMHYATGLTGGSNKFELLAIPYVTSAAVITIQNPYISVLAL